MNNKITNEDIENAKVTLKPVFGIKPGVYLTAIYGLITLFGLFLLLILPGMRNNGTNVYVETFPMGAAVYADDTYLGTTPLKAFIQKGEREIKIEKKYFETIKLQENIKSRIFGSLLFPGKLEIIENLDLIDEEGFLGDRFRQLSSYALIEDYYDRYQMPPLLTVTVSEYLSGTKDIKSSLLYNFLYNMRVNLGSPEMVFEYIKSIKIIIDTIVSDNSSSIKTDDNPDFSVIFNYFADENNTNGLALSIIKAYPIDKRKNIIEVLEKIDGLKIIIANLNSKSIDTDLLVIPVNTGKNVVISNMKFVGFSSGTYLSGPSVKDNTQILQDDFLISFPHTEAVGEFYILEKEITRNNFALFLNENPDWKIDNITNLIETNRANKEYLNLQDFTDGEKPISNISWFAASAYCDWLETKLPSHMSEYTVRLPSEAEWEAAALLNRLSEQNNIFKESGLPAAKVIDFSRIGSADLYDVMGNLWEWCDNWYFPTDSVNGSFGLPGESWEGMEKAVRGGSWANSKDDVNISSRGSQNPSWSTPFMGFRPVLVKN